MKVQGSTAFVTGANRGLGRAYAQALLDAGAARVYAGARDPSTVKLAGVVPVRIDVTDAASVAAASVQCGDTNIVVNNAGIIGTTPLLAAGGDGALRDVLETNLHGMLAVSRAFAPILRRNGGGALVNMLSVLSWLSLPATGAYSVSKAAAWALTNGLRNELRAQGTLVVAIHAGFIDTDMARGVDAAKARPEDIAKAAIAGLEADVQEVLADDTTRHVKQGLVAQPPAYLA
ncbi:MAG: SDR family oxidoreductase [Pseudoxanthomonas sp.]